jgi:hypothetical protein
MKWLEVKAFLDIIGYIISIIAFIVALYIIAKDNK